MTKDEWVMKILEHLNSKPSGAYLMDDFKQHRKETEYVEAVAYLESRKYIEPVFSGSYMDMVTVRGYSFLKDAKARQITAMQSNHVLTSIKNISLGEWTVVIALLSLIVAIWALFK